MTSVFTIEADAPFLERLATELWRRAEGDGLRLSRMLVLLPTRRACRHLGAVFAKIADGRPVLLPRMRPLGDVDEDELIFADSAALDVPPAIGSLKRLMLLTQQVQKRDPTLSWDQAAQAAEALTRFLDQIQIERCDVSRLPELVEEQELAEHWRQVVVFLEIVTKNWPSILEAHGTIDPAARRNAVMAAQTEAWRKAQPAFPVIAAGSTGSVPATADLLKLIAVLPQGAVILPGLDRGLDDAAWDEIEDTHPQYSMKNLLGKIGIGRADVKDWGAVAPISARARLLSEAMRPAGSTDAWRGLRGALGRDAVAGMERLVLDHPQEEAQVIALRLRALLETPSETAAFITADRGLAVRVAALLRRWGIDVDDSGGTPLAMLPLGAFLNLVLAAASPQAGTVDLLALLKHPLAACGMEPVVCRAEARAAEIRVRNLEDEKFAELRRILQPLSEAWRQPLTLTARIAAHVAVAEAVAASESEEGAARLWRGETGEDAAAWLDEWRAGADAFPGLDGRDYAALFGSLSASKILRSARTTHPRLSILGPLEARLIDADLIILGGMNEGAWPPDAGFDPWMSRPMRKKFNLPAPEFRIGLSAHDFAQLASARQVMLTRSLRNDGTPTVPSRFLVQLDTVLRAAGLSDDKNDALAPQVPWREWAHGLDAPDVIAPCPRPQPRPEVALRPVSLSVTEIGTWLRNPYAIYARHILTLKRLEELDAALDASDRGTMIHAALEKFTRDFPGALPVDAEARLLEIGRGIFAQDRDNPRVKAFWWARFVDIAGWFVAETRKRHEAGITLVKAEASGRSVVGHFTLKGRADRVDRLSDGTLAIIDYKTGAVPSKAEVESGIEPQLPLLALIAASGGFADVAAGGSGALEYWILKGGSGGCEIRKIGKDLPDLVARAEDGLRNLVEAFADPATAYEAAPRPRLQPRHNEYAHLSRLAEWGRTGEEG